MVTLSEHRALVIAAVTEALGAIPGPPGLDDIVDEVLDAAAAQSVRKTFPEAPIIPGNVFNVLEAIARRGHLKAPLPPALKVPGVPKPPPIHLPIPLPPALKMPGIPRPPPIHLPMVRA